VPLYEFQCHDCDSRVTVQRGFHETSTPHCHNCGGENLTRLISRVSVVKSETDRASDVSWIDRDVARRLKEGSQGKLNPQVKETLDWMESA
jgi:putative FmdB family regulatory protein